MKITASVPPPAPPPVKTFHIELNEEEASILHDIVGTVIDVTSPSKGKTEDLLWALWNQFKAEGLEHKFGRSRALVRKAEAAPWQGLEMLR